MEIILEQVGLVLPVAVELQPHLNAAKDHLLPALEINAQLYDITIVETESLALLGGRAQTDVVQERAR